MKGGEPNPIAVLPVLGIDEVTPGTDLPALVTAYVEEGDVVVVTSKVVSKAEGRVLALDRDQAVAQETDRDVARRGATRIVRNRLGLTLAAAGVDASNTSPGTVVLLPLDPDASARRFRDSLPVNAAVIVTDTAGRAWRHGQTDIAIGAAGLQVTHDYAGSVDTHGNPLTVTLPAVADELAGAADLVKGKLSGCPIVLVRGMGGLILPRGQHGPGAATLIRGEDQDLFGYGAREAVMHALLDDEHRGFGAPAPADIVLAALAALGVTARLEGGHVVAPKGSRVVAASIAHAWEVAEESGGYVRIRPRIT